MTAAASRLLARFATGTTCDAVRAGRMDSGSSYLKAPIPAVLVTRLPRNRDLSMEPTPTRSSPDARASRVSLGGTYLEAQLMMQRILPPLAALAVCAFASSAQAASNESSGPMRMERMQDLAVDHQALLDARLAGLKAGLKLTNDQEKLWPPFEAAVRDAAKLRMEQMKSMIERMQKMRDMMEGSPGLAVSPVDRLATLGQRLSERGAAITKVAEAAKPLYASLDDSQKRLFVILSREMFMMGRGHRGMEMMRSGMTGQRPIGEMRMMGGHPDRMEPTGNSPDEEDDDSDEE